MSSDEESGSGDDSSKKISANSALASNHIDDDDDADDEDDDSRVSTTIKKTKARGRKASTRKGKKAHSDSKNSGNSTFRKMPNFSGILQFRKFLQTNYNGFNDIKIHKPGTGETPIMTVMDDVYTSRLISICGIPIKDISCKELINFCTYVRIPGCKMVNKLGLCRLIVEYKENKGYMDPQYNHDTEWAKEYNDVHSQKFYNPKLIDYNTDDTQNLVKKLYKPNTKRQQKQKQSKNSNRPPPISVWAIRSCENLNGAALFTNRDDCFFYVDQMEDEEEMEYEEFSNVVDALKYLGLCDAASDGETTDDDDDEDDSEEEEDDDSDDESDNDDDDNNSTSNQIRTRAQLKRAALHNHSPGAAKASSSKRPSSAINEENQKFEESARPTKKQRRFANVVTQPDDDWEKHFQEFLDFRKEVENSDELLPTEDVRKNEKYQELEPWITRQRGLLRQYVRDPESVLPENLERVRKLLRAGLKMKSIPAKDIELWDKRYQEAKDYKEKYGHLDVNMEKPGFDRALQQWINKAKHELRKYEADEYCILGPHRVKRLRELGLKPAEKPQTKKGSEDIGDTDTENRNDLNAASGALGTPQNKADVSENTDAKNIASRKSDSACRNLKKTPPSTIGTRVFCGPVLKRGQKPARISWDENFQKLKEYKELHGVCYIIRGTAKNDWFSSLPEFLTKERTRFRRVQLQEKYNPENVLPQDREKIQKLLDLGVVLEHKSETRKAKKASVNLSFVNEAKVAKWEENYEALKQYKEKHGRCRINKNLESSSASLIPWVSHQRVQIRHYDEGDGECDLDEERIHRLKELGLKPARKMEPDPDRECTWEEMYEKLKKFKEEHGHVEVPAIPRKGLRSWILKQREHFARMKAGKKSKMTPERLSLLLDVGLAMTMKATMSFEDRAAQWLDYKTKHGRDPPGISGPLGSFVQNTRRKYRLFHLGVKTSLTQERIDLLNRLGFKWSSGIKKPEIRTPRKTWDERFQELIEYKAKHGHVNVPQASRGLGTWVHGQRQEVSRLRRGLKCFITPEQVEKLRSVGFIFLTRKSPLETYKKRREKELGLIASDESAGEEQNGPNYNSDREINIHSFW